MSQPKAATAGVTTPAPTDIDTAALNSTDEAEMAVMLNGAVTTWIWTFAGPGHERTIAQSNRLSRQRLQEEREKEQARVNGKKWKGQEETPDEVRRRNVDFVVERLLGWSPVRLDGQDLPFTAEAARHLLLDPRKSTLLVQAFEFLGEDKSFIRRSA